MKILSLTFVSVTDTSLIYDVEHEVGILRKKTRTDKVILKKVGSSYYPFAEDWSTGDNFLGSINASHVADIIVHDYNLNHKPDENNNDKPSL